MDDVHSRAHSKTCPFFILFFTNARSSMPECSREKFFLFGIIFATNKKCIGSRSKSIKTVRKCEKKNTCLVIQFTRDLHSPFRALFYEPREAHRDLILVGISDNNRVLFGLFWIFLMQTDQFASRKVILQSLFLIKFLIW